MAAAFEPSNPSLFYQLCYYCWLKKVPLLCEWSKCLLAWLVMRLFNVWYFIYRSVSRSKFFSIKWLFENICTLKNCNIIKRPCCFEAADRLAWLKTAPGRHVLNRKWRWIGFSVDYLSSSHCKSEAALQARFRRDRGRIRWQWSQVWNIVRYIQGTLKGEVLLYCWTPVWLVWNQLYDNWEFF